MDYVTIKYEFEITDSDRLHERARHIDSDIYEELNDIDDPTAVSILLDRVPLERITSLTHGVKIEAVTLIDRSF